MNELPCLEIPRFQLRWQVAKRILTLTALFQLYLEMPKEEVSQWIHSNRLSNELTEKEKTFLAIDFDQLPKQDQIDISWYIEAVWAFAWIGNLHNNLTFNTAVEDHLVDLLPNVQQAAPAASFVANFQLRDHLEIFTQLDLFYRAHWFAKPHRLSHEGTPKVNLDLITERRKALEYTCYNYLLWDEISLDT
jgi:hypothetical protein